MPDYHDQLVALLLQGQCQRLDHIGLGIYKWYSPKNGVRFQVEPYYPSIKAANEVLVRAGLAAVIKPTRN
jgi:hypothetical protein